MRRYSFVCVRWWPLALLGLPAIFMLPLLAAKWHPIEADVQKNTLNSLKAAGESWANVETFNRGRHVLITGTPPKLEAINRVRELAKSSYGVDAVTISSNVKALPELATLLASVNGNKIQLRGEVSSTSEVQSLIKDAEMAFGKGNVDNQLTVGSNTATLPNNDSLFSVLANNASEFEGLKVHIVKNNVTFEGEANSLIAKSVFDNDLNHRFKSQFKNQLTVAPPTFLTITECQTLINELLVNNKINFDSGKAVIQTQSYPLLKTIKQTTQECPDLNMEISGHTDSSGSLAYNISLSQARADAVLDHLINIGIDEARLKSIGFGPNKAIDDNSTADGRARNRRIEFKLKIKGAD